MEREEILGVVIKHIRQNVADLADDEIDPGKSMVDYGAGSLDIVEVVSASMRELRIKIPRTELADLQNIDQLVDKFVEVKGRAA